MKKNRINISDFVYENRQKFALYVSKNTFKKHGDLIIYRRKRPILFQYALIKDYNTFMYNQTLHRDRKHFCCYCFQSFSTAQILERHVNDCFEINGKQVIKMTKEGETVNFEKLSEKNKITIYDLC